MDHAVLNKILEARVKDLAARKAPRNQTEHKERITGQRFQLAQSLGLHPAPPRTELNAQVTGVIQRDGYRIEKLRYESRPGFLVTAHLYLPDTEGRHPLILSPHGHWPYKKCTPTVQARGIGLALLGFACLIVDSPGFSWDDNGQNERKAQGTHDDPWLTMGAPVQGHYVWDLVRGLDYCESRSEIDTTRVGITGESGGGGATMLTFAFEERIQAAVPVCGTASMEIMPHNGCFCNHLAALMEIGDRSDLIGVRAPAPVCFVGATDDPEFPAAGHEKSAEKLAALYGKYKAEGNVRLELIEGQHDYNRRMREAMYAFFSEHLKGEPRRGHIPEPRPLTDGGTNPFESGTEKHDMPELLVTQPDERATATFRQLLEKALTEPHPAEFDAEKRLVPWGKYGPVDLRIATHDLILADIGTMPSSDHTIELNPKELDIRLLIYLGLSPAEFVAQMLHLHLPGKPEGWEANALQGGDAISSMIASVKTLVKPAEAQEAVRNIRAVGQFSSLVAAHVKLLREGLEVEASFSPASWHELYQTQNVALLQPGARYLKWPF